MIDWTKPIEMVPCERNPEPVACEVKLIDDRGEPNIFIRGNWYSSTGSNQNDGYDQINAWRYKTSGEPYTSIPAMLPLLRNVEPS